ncbi:MAG: hypothetical protein V2J10_06075, partial [Wenzhouxiangella sp.]|nr:hypothetical protein [Wenzhouxiangella sp.]
MRDSIFSWKRARIALFITVGLMNTLLIRPEDVYTFKHFLGMVLLTIGLVEGGYVFLGKIRRALNRRNRADD